MADTMIDYALLNANKTIDDLPFSTVDGLIFAQLSYLKFNGFVPNSGKDIKGYLLSKIVERKYSNKIFAKSKNDNNKKLFNAIAYSKRFGKVRAKYYEEITEKDSDTQFSAITFVISPELNVISFRGTDSTIIGWKENCDMLFRSPVSSQDISVAYLDKVIPKLEGKVIVVGHSKGGNLAIYGSALCKKENKKRILSVMSYDNPGFTDAFLKSRSYAEIESRVIKTVPEASMIGMLLSNKSNANFSIVKSEGTGMYQHDPFTWQVANNRFIPTDSIDMTASFVDSTFNEWVFGCPPEQREQFIELIFGLIEKTNESKAPTFRQWVDNLKMNLPLALEGVRGLTPEERELMRKVMGNLFSSAGGNIVSSPKRILKKTIRKITP